jgi:hypothetical protein
MANTNYSVLSKPSVKVNDIAVSSISRMIPLAAWLHRRSQSSQKSFPLYLFLIRAFPPFSTFFHLNTIILVRRPYRTPFPFTTIRITGKTLASNRNIRVLMTCEYLLCSLLKQAINSLSRILNKLKRLLIADLCRFLLDKRDLGLRRRE